MPLAALERARGSCEPTKMVHGPEDDTDAERIRGAPVSNLLVKLAIGWTPPAYENEQVQGLSWGGVDYTAQTSDVAIEKDALTIAWDEWDGLDRLASGRDAGTTGDEINGTLSSGWKLAAEQAFFRTNRLVEAHYWTMTRPEHEAVAWVAEVHGLDVWRTRGVFGNLAITTRTSRSDGEQLSSTFRGHRFRGAHTYYLVPGPQRDGQPSRWFFVVDPGDAVPTRKELYNDVLALQFALGTAFYVDVLQGFDARLERVAFLGGRLGRDHSHRPRVEHVVPSEFQQEHWAPVLFEAISAAYRARPDLRLHIALSFYLDGLASFHVEGRYLALHVGLEAFAYWLLRADGIEEPDLVDKTKWKPWLRANQENIRSLAAPGMENTLHARFTSLGVRRASSRVVEAAFKRYNLATTQEMANELEFGRNRVVHMAVMFEERQEDVNAYLTRIAVVRTMMTALLARVVEYRGAILGWTRKRRHPYEPVDASWWSVDPSAREQALLQYDVEADVSDVTTSARA